MTTTDTPRKTERIWMSPWTSHGFREDRLGIELNREAKTILVWTQGRRYFMVPKIAKHVKALSGGRMPYARDFSFDLFGDDDDIKDGSPTNELLDHLHYGKLDRQIKEFFKLKRTKPYSMTADDAEEWRNSLLSLVEDGVVWRRRTKPLLVMVISFKKKLPALYQASPIKKKSRKLKLCNRTWSAESAVSQLATFAPAEIITEHLCRAASMLLERECKDLVDVLRPSIKERVKADAYKMECYPQFVRDAFNHVSAVEGMAKVIGSRGRRTRRLAFELLSKLEDKRASDTYLPLYLAYLGRRIISAEETQKILLRNDWDNKEGYAGMFRGLYSNKTAPTLRRRLKHAPPEFRVAWLLTFKNVEYCQDTLNTLDQIVCGEIELDWSEVPKNGNEAHDYLAKVLTRKKKEGMYKYVLKISKKFEQLHGSVVELGDLKATFRLPENKGEIYEWGEEQHHCIASYADRHAAGECVLLEVVVNDKKFHMQLEGNQIRQFYGRFNKPPEPEIDKAVRAYLRKEKFIRD